MLTNTFRFMIAAFLAVVLTVEVKTTRTYTTNFRHNWQNAAGAYSDCSTNDNVTAISSYPNTNNRDASGPFENTDDPEALAHAVSLIRARPRNLHLVFLGDSVTRYQYLSLAYFLRWGRWFDPHQLHSHLVDAHSYRHPYHPDQDWNEFFWQSNRLLHPLETCDCQRSRNTNTAVLERRYFYDVQRNNTLTYINLNGNKTHNPAGGYAGRLDAAAIYPNFHQHVGLVVSNSSSTAPKFAWEAKTWAAVIEEHVALLRPKPETAVLNAGLHSHNFELASERHQLAAALQRNNIQSVWKTTTFQKSQLLALEHPVATAAATSSSNSRHADEKMCQALDTCFNLSWTNRLQPDLYFDDLHFREPVYRILNEDLLVQLDKLPAAYQRLERSTVLWQEQ